MGLPQNPNRGGLPARPLAPQRDAETLVESELPTIEAPTSTASQDSFAPQVSQTPSEPEAPQSTPSLFSPTFENDSTFETLPPSIAVYDDDEFAEQQPTPTPIQPQPTVVSEFDSFALAHQKRLSDGFENVQGAKTPPSRHTEYRPQSGDLDQKGQNVYIDKNRKTVEPFGGKKSLKIGDIDKRKNLKQQAKMFQVVVTGLLILIVGLGAFNAVFPSQGLSEGDVSRIVQNTTRTTAFPLEGGQGFATDFMNAYLNLGSSPSSQTILSYFYTGRMIPGGQYPNRGVDPNYGQVILAGPTVYEARYLTNEVGNYTFGALIQPVEKKPVQQYDAQGNLIEVQTPVYDGTGATWQFFSVNVYYDKEQKRFAISPDSPTVVPAPQVLYSVNAPAAQPIGSGKLLEDQNAVKATVQAFMTAYQASSPTNHIKLDPLIPSNPDNSLLTGLDSKYTFKGGTVDSGMRFKAYSTTNEEIKVHVTVDWEQSISLNVSTSYLSQYVMTLEPTSTGYVVTKFAPYYYLPVNK